jgi:hypothetical protein
MVAHTYNPSCSVHRDWEEHGSIPGQKKNVHETPLQSMAGHSGASLPSLLFSAAQTGESLVSWPGHKVRPSLKGIQRRKGWWSCSSGRVPA